MPATQRGQAYRLGPEPMGPALLRRRRQPPAQEPVPEQVAPRSPTTATSSSRMLRGEPAALPELTLAELVDALPRAPRRRRPPPHDRHPPRTARLRHPRLRRRAAARPRADERRTRRRGSRRCRRGRATASCRHSGRRSTPPSGGGTSSATRRSSPAATRQPAPRTVRAFTVDELDAIAAELSADLPAAASVRRRDRPATRGMGGARTPRHRPQCAASSTCAAPSATGEICRTRQDERQPPASAALAARARRARRAAAAAATRRCCSRRRRRAAEPRPLPPPRVGARDRSVRRSTARRASTTCARRSRAARSPPASRVFELAKIMGTSVQMIERHYGTLLDGAGAGIAARLDAYDAQHEQDAETADDVWATIGPSDGLSVQARKPRISAVCSIFRQWSQPGSNRRPPACKAGALPTELWPREGRV